jgi:N6-adenosine-specific RNA methylase IME4
MMWHGLPEGAKYNCIYADPPWLFKNYSEKGEGRNPNQHYPCMPLEEIKALPVAELAAENCVLLMWVYNPMLPEALELIKAWGFEFKTVGFVWSKQRISTGYWTRSMTEQCWLATRGKPSRKDMGVRQVLEAPPLEHSRKPALFYHRIEALVDGPYLELFARNRRTGWDTWGNETEKFGGTLSQIHEGQVEAVEKVYLGMDLASGPDHTAITVVEDGKPRLATDAEKLEFLLNQPREKESEAS